MVGIWLWQGEEFHPLAINAQTKLQEDFLQSNVLPADFQRFIREEAQGKPFVERKMMIHEINDVGVEQSSSEAVGRHCFTAWQVTLREFRVRRIFCIPLLHFGQLLGVLLLFSDDPTAFDEGSVYWLEQLMPLLASSVYEQQLRMAAVDREQALSLLLRGTEILVKAVSEEQLLAEAGEMAMEILYLEAGFFHMEMDGEWKLHSPFGRLKQSETVWQEWIRKDKQAHFPQGYIPNDSPTLRILEEEEYQELPYPVEKILIQPIKTYRGVVGEFWLIDSRTRDIVHTQEILYAFVRMLSMALETIRQRKELEHLATTDSLTGIMNRQGFEQRILCEMAGTLRRRSTFLFLLLDLDGFKNLNDTKGHPTGDQALSHVAQNLLKSVRQEDIVARTGGDEFAVVLTDLKLNQDAMNIMERLRSNLNLESYNLGISIGVAEFPTESVDYESLYKLSDHRLYLGKQRGKGHIVTGKFDC
jgi:diguanylate cyclase (GGDEF)-like protein